MFQNPNVLLDFSNYGPVDDWTQVTVNDFVPVVLSHVGQSQRCRC